MIFDDTVIETAIFLTSMVIVWTVYGYYVHFQARQSNPASLSYNLRQQRIGWVQRILLRDSRISDASLLAAQERVATFFATTTLLILATLITAINSGSDLSTIPRDLFDLGQGISDDASRHKSMLTLLALAVVFMFAFFKFTWSVRQYGFISVLIGNAPLVHEQCSKEDRERFVFHVAQLLDYAGHNSNSGLRAFYFSLPVLTHTLSPVVGVLTLFVVVLILYDRELNSYTITCVRKSNIELDDRVVQQGQKNP